MNMKPLLPKLILVATLLPYAGCQHLPSGPDFSFDPTRSSQALCLRYGPARADILPLTELVPAASSSHDSRLDVYICLLDSFDSQIKSPAVFRFELFEFAERSTEQKGKRITIWPDIDLTEPAVNNQHWQDFLRAYLFPLPIQKPSENAYILHATCLCQSGKRLSVDFLIRTSH